MPKQPHTNRVVSNCVERVPLRARCANGQYLNMGPFFDSDFKLSKAELRDFFKMDNYKDASVRGFLINCRGRRKETGFVYNGKHCLGYLVIGHNVEI